VDGDGTKQIEGLTKDKGSKVLMCFYYAVGTLGSSLFTLQGSEGVVIRRLVAGSKVASW